MRRAQENGVRVGRVLADGAYDSKANFRFLAEEGIKPIIRVAKNSVPVRQWCYPRKVARAITTTQFGIPYTGNLSTTGAHSYLRLKTTAGT